MQLKIKLSCILFLLYFLPEGIRASIVVPGYADNIWTPGGSSVNTALIDVPSYNDDRNYPWKQLAACAYGNGVIVTDFVSGFSVNTLYPFAGGPGTAMASAPDVILGNNTSSPDPTRNFIMAVAFANNSNRSASTARQLMDILH